MRVISLNTPKGLEDERAILRSSRKATVFDILFFIHVLTLSVNGDAPGDRPKEVK
ncbi:MAG: hypothetical protein VKL39_15160 [Leptolyngbyaceae bacterium]|nr:hypothetical protein [Leptolyngbyaceae bacterium]